MIPEDIKAIFAYIEEKFPDITTWTYHEYDKTYTMVSSQKPMPFDLKIEIATKERDLPIRFYYWKLTKNTTKWEKFEQAFIVSDINFTVVDRAIKYLGILKGGMGNWGKFDEFGKFKA